MAQAIPLRKMYAITARRVRSAPPQRENAEHSKTGSDASAPLPVKNAPKNYCFAPNDAAGVN
jgi:hypothetical protein